MINSTMKNSVVSKQDDIQSNFLNNILIVHYALSNLMSLLSPLIPLTIEPTTLLKADYFISPPFSSAIINWAAQLSEHVDNFSFSPHFPHCPIISLHSLNFALQDIKYF